MHETALSESKKEPEASRVSKDVKKEKEPEISQVTKLTALPESKKEPEYSQVTCVLTKKKPGKSLKKGSCPRCVRWLTMLWLCCCFLPTAVATRSSPSCALDALKSSPTGSTVRGGRWAAMDSRGSELPAAANVSAGLLLQQNLHLCTADFNGSWHADWDDSNRTLFVWLLVSFDDCNLHLEVWPQFWFSALSICLLLGKCFKTKRKRPRKPRQTRCRPSNVTSLRRCWAACRFVGKKRCCGARTKCRRRVWKRVMTRRTFRFRPGVWSTKSFSRFGSLSSKGFAHQNGSSPSGFDWSGFTPEYLDLLLSTKLTGGASKNGIPRRKRAKKPNGGGSELGEYTRDVIAVLKQCLNSGASLDQLWTILQSSIPQAQRSGGSKVRKKKNKQLTQKTEVQPNKTGWNEPAPQVKYWTDGLGNARAYTVDSNGWYTWVDSKHAGSPKTPETGQSRSVFSGPQNFLGRDSKWVSGLRLADWDVTVPPKLVSFPKIKSCLRSGESFGGNVCEIWDYHTLEELLTLWSCFQQTQGLTALLFGDAKQKAQGACHARLSLTRGSFGHKLEDPGLLKIGEGRGPWLPVSKKVDITSIPKVQRETLRISAPSCFRTPFLGAKHEDSPTEVIKHLAAMTGSPTSEFFGGRWSFEEKKEGKQLIVFLRLKPALIATLVDLSGNSGLFMTHIKPKGTSDLTPFWIARQPKENHETYHRRVLQLQLERKQPMLFRVGTGDTLGFPKRNTDHKPEKARLHVVQGVPRAWGYEDLQSFLEKQQWTEISALSKRRSTWSFLAKAPEEPTARASWQYDIQDADTTSWSITIQVAVRSQNGPQSRVAVTGPRKIRTLGDFIPEDYSAANDSEVLKDAAENSTVQNVPLQPPSQGVSLQRDGRASPARGRSRSPKGTNEVAATVPDSQAQGEETSSPVKVDQEPPKKPKISEPSDPTQAIDSFGWRHWDQGGTGDCFFRVASVFMSNAAERPSAEDSRRDGAWLRAQTCQHLKKHEVRFGQLFQNKSEWATWLASVARPNTWAEGKALQALSEKIGKPLIIWEKKTEDATVVFTRFVVAPKFSKGFACGAKDQEPVCAILENKHYTVLRPPHKGSVPASWLRETPNTVIDLQGGAKQCDTRSARGSPSLSNRSALRSVASGLPATPSVRTLVGSRRSAAGPASATPSVAAGASIATPSVHSLGSAVGGSCAASRPRPLRPRASCSAAPTPSVHTCVAALPAGGSAVAVGPASGAGSSRAGPSLPRRSRAASISPRPQPHASKRGVVKTQFSGGTKAKKFGSLPSCSAWKPDSSIQRNGPAAKRPKDAAAEKEPVVLFAPKVLSEDPALKEPTWERPVFRKGRRPTKVKMRLWGKQPDPRQGPKWSASMPWAWTCPIHTCGLVIKGTYSGVSQARYFHVRSKHPEVDPSFFHSEPPDVPVATSPDLPKAQRAWSCPLCSHGLPALSLQVKKRAVRAHCAAFHPKKPCGRCATLIVRGWKTMWFRFIKKRVTKLVGWLCFPLTPLFRLNVSKRSLKTPIGGDKVIIVPSVFLNLEEGRPTRLTCLVRTARPNSGPMAGFCRASAPGGTVGSPMSPRLPSPFWKIRVWLKGKFLLLWSLTQFLEVPGVGRVAGRLPVLKVLAGLPGWSWRNLLRPRLRSPSRKLRSLRLRALLGDMGVRVGSGSVRLGILAPSVSLASIPGVTRVPGRLWNLASSLIFGCCKKLGWLTAKPPPSVALLIQKVLWLTPKMELLGRVPPKRAVVELRCWCAVACPKSLVPSFLRMTAKAFLFGSRVFLWDPCTLLLMNIVPRLLVLVSSMPWLRPMSNPPTNASLVVTLMKLRVMAFFLKSCLPLVAAFLAWVSLRGLKETERSISFVPIVLKWLAGSPLLTWFWVITVSWRQPLRSRWCDRFVVSFPKVPGSLVRQTALLTLGATGCRRPGVRPKNSLAWNRFLLILVSLSKKSGITFKPLYAAASWRPCMLRSLLCGAPNTRVRWLLCGRKPCLPLATLSRCVSANCATGWPVGTSWAGWGPNTIPMNFRCLNGMSSSSWPGSSLDPLLSLLGKTFVLLWRGCNQTLVNFVIKPRTPTWCPGVPNYRAVPRMSLNGCAAKNGACVAGSFELMAPWLRPGMRALRPSRPFGNPSGRTCVGPSLPSRNGKLLFSMVFLLLSKPLTSHSPLVLSCKLLRKTATVLRGLTIGLLKSWSTCLWMSSIRCLSSFEPLPLPGMCRSSYGSLAWFVSPRKAKFTTTVLKLVMPGQSVSCLCGGAFGAHRSVVAPPFVPGFVQCFWRMLVASLEKISMRTSLRSLTTSTSMVSCSLWTIARPLTVLTATFLAACFVLMDGLLIWFIYWKQLGVSRSDLCNGTIIPIQAPWMRAESSLRATLGGRLGAAAHEPVGSSWGPNCFANLWSPRKWHLH